MQLHTINRESAGTSISITRGNMVHPLGLEPRTYGLKAHCWYRPVQTRFLNTFPA